MTHLKTLLPYARPYRTGIAFGLLLVVLSNGFTVATPWFLRLGIDALSDPEATRRRIVGYAAFLVGAAIVGGAMKYGMRELLNGISRRMECDLRDDYFRHLLRLDAPFFARYRTGDLMSRASNDTLAVRQAAGPAVMYAVNTTVISILALGFMLWISPRLTGLAMIPMIFLPPIVLGFGRVIQRRFDRIQEQFSSLSTLVQENLTGVRLIRAYGQEADQAKRFHAMNDAYLERNLHLARAQGLLHPALMLLTGIALVLVLLVGGREVMEERISVGDFVAFTFYLSLLTWPLIALGWVIGLFQRGEASMRRLNEILNEVPQIVPEVGTVPGVRSDGARGLKGALAFENVSFRYPGTDRDVLQGVSFHVEPGETVAIVGATGSGKSTLVSLLSRTYDPTGGQILLDGVPLRDYEPQALRRHLGIVPQDAFLFSESIEANLALGIPDGVVGAARTDRVLEASRAARLHEQVEGFPQGYETPLGERGINLSGGQKQRLTLARALARDPSILVLDDALSAVDTQTEAEILAQLRRVLAGRTAFLISHRVSAVMDADRILVLGDGMLVESGTHASLLAEGGAYARLHRRQRLEQEVEGEPSRAEGAEGAQGAEGSADGRADGRTEEGSELYYNLEQKF